MKKIINIILARHPKIIVLRTIQRHGSVILAQIEKLFIDALKFFFAKYLIKKGTYADCKDLPSKCTTNSRFI